VLIKDKAAYIIDADSFQFRSPSRFYPGVMLKDDFTDPLLYDKSSQDLKLKKGARASIDTDWYAYNAMLMQSLLLVKPYGGKYTHNVKIEATERIRLGFTIFNKDVDLPDWAIHPSMLPDNLLQHFYEVFGADNKRGSFPEYLLNMYWTKCTNCGAEHARTRCPNCYRTVTSGSAQPGMSGSSASLPGDKKLKDSFWEALKEIFNPIGSSFRR
jgi:H/ACA ribonucleoprotein complex subunit 3